MSRSDKPRQLGLDDPKVNKRVDRGEDDCNAEHMLAPSTYPISDHTAPECEKHGNDVFSMIRCELEASIIPRTPESHDYFIPRAKLRSIITDKRVTRIIEQLPCCRDLLPNERAELHNTICSGSTPCRKLLAVLLANKQEERLLHLVKEGVSDQCLPIRKNTPCCVEGHNHPTINSWSRKERCDISISSYAVKAPYFTRPRGGHNHYILDSNDVIPITRMVSNVLTSDAPPIHHKSGTENSTVHGGFSQVTRIVLDQSHYHFEGLAARDNSGRPRQFALKKLLSASRETFSQELASLRSFQDQDDKHLIKLLATYEVREQQYNGTQTPTTTTTYFLLFPWANGDLWTFWKAHAYENQRLPKCLWMAEQVYELGKAIMYIHKERRRQLMDMAFDESDHELYGRHGDIKAENILWFAKDSGEPGTRSNESLVITDFGLGRLNSKYSRSKVDPQSIEKTATYKAPEFDLRRGKVSRVSDIFSFGCTCLEFVTWYLEGWEAVSEQFPDYRLEDDIHGQESDIFFRIETMGMEERAIVKPKVKEWISRLRDNRNCSSYILQFLELIEERMLEPESSRRIKSGDLVKKLEVLYEGCRREPSFYLTPSNRL